MKATKKIVGAACALVAAVALSAGSTFAWFTTNSHVSATGMQITVDTASQYLVIKGSAQAQDAQGQAVDLTNPDNYTKDNLQAQMATTLQKLKPSAHDNFAAVADVTAAAKWYTAIGQSASNGAAQTNSKAALNSTTGYVYSDTLYFTMLKVNANQSTVTGNNLCVTSVTAANLEGESGTMNHAISVIFVCGNNIVEYKWDENATTTTGSNTTVTPKYVPYVWDATTSAFKPDATASTKLADTVTSTEVTQVQVYVYYDGNNTEVKTDNIASLVGAKLTFGFDLVEETQEETETPTA